MRARVKKNELTPISCVGYKSTLSEENLYTPMQKGEGTELSSPPGRRCRTAADEGVAAW